MTYSDLLVQARQCVDEALKSLGLETQGYVVEPSARAGFGDVSCNAAFLAAKKARQKPSDLASKIATACSATPLIERIEAHASGHINFIANVEALNKSVISSCKDVASSIPDVGHKSKVTVEHTSVNPNKALHIGHMRNVVLGDVISRILRATNHEVRVLNYVDDLGLQVANLVMGFTKFGFSESDTQGKRFDQYCGDVVYVEAMKRIDADPTLKEDAKKTLEAMEDTASSESKIAKKISARILSEQLCTCWRIGARYDCLNYESHIVGSGMWNKVFEVLKKSPDVRLEKGGKNDGCWIVPGSEPEYDKVLVRSNGVPTYIAKDIPYAAWKLGKIPDPFEYGPYPQEQPDKPLVQTLDGTQKDAPALVFERVITVIDSRQSMLQGIVTDMLAKLYDVQKGQYVHLAYESVTLSKQTALQLGLETGGKNVQMSGRSGLFINADHVIDMLQERARTETAKRNSDMDQKELDDISTKLAIGAMRYEMIRQDLDKMITFDLAQSMRLDGDTSSYMQYAHARAQRILEKVGESKVSPDYAALSGPHERELVRAIGTLGIAVQDAAVNLSPKVVARYAHELTVAFNAFYEHVRIMGSTDPEAATSARIELVKSFQTALVYALGILGIPAPARM